MAIETVDLNSLQVGFDLAQQKSSVPIVAQLPGYGPEMSEAILAEGAGGGGVAGPAVAETSYPGIHEGSVLLAPPGFTVCESFFDSGEFTCFNPEVVCGTEVKLLPNGSFSAGDAVWCNVTIKDGKIASAELATDADGEATVSVHVADIRSDGVKQYHVGAVIVAESSAARPDDISVEVCDLRDAQEGDDASSEEGDDASSPSGRVLALKGWHGKSSDRRSDPSPVVGSKFLEMAILGTTGPICHIPSRDKSDGSMAYQDVEHGLIEATDTLAQIMDPTAGDGGYKVLVAHANKLMMAEVGNLAEPSVDDSSIEIKELGGKKKLQIKGWDTQTPADMTLAAILKGKASAPGPLLVRGDNVQYLPIGSLTGLTGLTGLTEPSEPQSVIIDIQYDTESHQIQVKRAKLSGHIKIDDVDEEWSMITGGQAVQHTSGSNEA